MEPEHTFKFDQYLILAIIIFMAIPAPVLSIYDVFSDGVIDVNEQAPGRYGGPLWLTYVFGWGVFLWFLVVFIAPAIRYIWKGRIFTLRGDELVIGDENINRKDLTGFSSSSLRGVKLSTTNGVIYFRPSFSSKGWDAFLKYYGDS